MTPPTTMRNEPIYRAFVALVLELPRDSYDTSAHPLLALLQGEMSRCGPCGRCEPCQRWIRLADTIVPYVKGEQRR